MATAKTLCGFCQRAGKITKEHVFAKWLGPIISAGQPVKAIRHDIALDGKPKAQWESTSLDTQVRMACGPCNSGWMNALETKMQAIIPPMILGRRQSLDIESQAAIATWAIKTAMVIEFLRPRDPSYFTPAERHALMDEVVPAGGLGAHVWLGCYSGTNDGLRSSATRLMRTPGVAEGYELMFALRAFTLQVFVERRSAGRGTYIRAGQWAQSLVEIWPTGGPVDWPPPVSIDEDSAAALFDRFLAPGIESLAKGFRRSS